MRHCCMVWGQFDGLETYMSIFFLMVILQFVYGLVNTPPAHRDSTGTCR